MNVIPDAPASTSSSSVAAAGPSSAATPVAHVHTTAAVIALDMLGRIEAQATEHPPTYHAAIHTPADATLVAADTKYGAYAIGC